LSRQRRHFGLWRAARFKERIPAMALLERLGMAEQADRPAGVLAYGDVKRLELALALALEPELLLMDEPTAGMAAEERHALMALAGELVAERGLGLLFTEHDMDVVFAHADRVLVLARGEVLAEGPPAAIRADREVRALYLGQGFGEAA
jgi:branched-chain amino acid transport system ATP-binding protein